QLELWYEFFQTGSDKLPSLFESVIQPDPVSVSPTPASTQATSASLPFEPSDTAPGSLAGGTTDGTTGLATNQDDASPPSVEAIAATLPPSRAELLLEEANRLREQARALMAEEGPYVEPDATSSSASTSLDEETTTDTLPVDMTATVEPEPVSPLTVDPNPAKEPVKEKGRISLPFEPEPETEPEDAFESPDELLLDALASPAHDDMASTSELPFTPPPVNTPSLDLNLAVLPSDTTSDADDLDDDMDSVGMGTPHEVDEPERDEDSEEAADPLSDLWPGTAAEMGMEMGMDTNPGGHNAQPPLATDHGRHHNEGNEDSDDDDYHIPAALTPQQAPEEPLQPDENFDELISLLQSDLNAKGHPPTSLPGSSLPTIPASAFADAFQDQLDQQQLPLPMPASPPADMAVDMAAVEQAVPPNSSPPAEATMFDQETVLEDYADSMPSSSGPLMANPLDSQDAAPLPAQEEETVYVESFDDMCALVGNQLESVHDLVILAAFYMTDVIEKDNFTL
ncbi:MAG: hypothetical protein KC475_12660, partial [Cyanobacteria bacterium HKST-UBA03]|nr:hypothetical protein [Cyanobacteria bacterium HKST-UBA03]